MRDKVRKLLDSKTVWLVLKHLRKLWVRAASFAILAITTAALAQALGSTLPSDWGKKLGADAVDQVLTILATSMLAVTTFSLSISVSAFSSAARSATPRATALLREDNTTQNVLATFLGAFLFSLLSIVALNAGYYTQSGRLVLFAVTVLVITLVVVALIRWISHLTRFGRIEDTLDRVETAARKALEKRIESPWLGGQPQTGPVPANLLEVFPDKTGYIQHIDMEALSKCAVEMELEIYVAALPGNFVYTGSPLMYADGGKLSSGNKEDLRRAFTCGTVRDFDQDPRFGLIVMSEIASRALSPAVNDPGTAIDVIGRMVRLLTPWRSNVEAKIDYPKLTVPSIETKDLMEDAFRSISRDGSAIFEVQIRIQKALLALSEIDPDTFLASATGQSKEAIFRAGKSGLTELEVKRLETVAAQIGSRQ